MASFNKYNVFVVDLGKAVHDFTVTTGDQLMVALTNTAPDADTNLLLANITEITAEHGYSAGGETCSITGWDDDDAAGTAELVTTDAVFTASGGTVGPFRYVVLYNSDTVVKTDPLIGWWEYAGGSITLQDTETFTVDFDDGTGSGTLTLT